MTDLFSAEAALVVSPHLDDAVLSCAQLIKSRPGTTVVTVLAGYPPGTHAGWSARTTGLAVAKDANLRRRQEDERAAQILGFRPTWMDVCAREYDAGESTDERQAQIEAALYEALSSTEARALFVPLGVTHPDHVAVSDVALRVAAGTDKSCFTYMDMPYGQARPGRVRRRLRALRKQFVVERSVQFAGDLPAKAEAVRAYSSQISALQAFGRHFDRIFTDQETYWRILSRPGGESAPRVGRHRE